MATDYAEKEREFIDSLAADTGRDLDGWMAAIDAEGLSDRNAIIDWLRVQRFTFARASWLERIHHNGGRPVYATKPDPRLLGLDKLPEPRAERSRGAPFGGGAPDVPSSAAGPAASAAQPARDPSSSAPPAGKPAAEPAASDRSGAPAPSLDDILSRAKAYRPLALHVLSTLAEAMPGIAWTPRGSLVSITGPAEFAVLAVSAKDVRLGLALSDHPGDGAVVRGRLPGAGEHITHVAVLTDARKVDATLVTLATMARQGVL